MDKHSIEETRESLKAAMSSDNPAMVELAGKVSNLLDDTEEVLSWLEESAEVAKGATIQEAPSGTGFRVFSNEDVKEVREFQQNLHRIAEAGKDGAE